MSLFKRKIEDWQIRRAIRETIAKDPPTRREIRDIAYEEAQKAIIDKQLGNPLYLPSALKKFTLMNPLQDVRKPAPEIEIPDFAIPVDVAAANAIGALGTIVRSDHVHAHPDLSGVVTPAHAHGDLSTVTFGQHHEHYLRYLWDAFGRCLTQEFTMSVAGRVWLVPIQVSFTLTIDRLAVIIRTAVGNIRLCLYEDNGDVPDGGSLVRQSASVAAAADKQEVTIADAQLTPGLYWGGIQSDSTTAKAYFYISAMAQGGTLLGRLFDVAGGYGAVPDPCPVTSTTNTAPVMFLRVASTP